MTAVLFGPMTEEAMDYTIIEFVNHNGELIKLFHTIFNGTKFLIKKTLKTSLKPLHKI